jgi:hypothetical protein
MDVAIYRISGFAETIIGDKLISMENIDQISRDLQSALADHEGISLYILWLKNTVYTKYLSDDARKKRLEEEYTKDVLCKFVYNIDRK